MCQELEIQSQDGKVIKAFQAPPEPFKFFPGFIFELELSGFSSCLWSPLQTSSVPSVASALRGLVSSQKLVRKGGLFMRKCGLGLLTPFIPNIGCSGRCPDTARAESSSWMGGFLRSRGSGLCSLEQEQKWEVKRG